MLQTMLDEASLAPDEIRRLSRHDYDGLVRLGAFEDEHLELLRGQLVTMSPQGGLHATVSGWLLQRLSIALGMAYDLRGHSPYAAADDSQPEPDLSISRRVLGRLDHPSEALLVVEVSESSIRKDREVKAEIYAEANIPEYWIIDLSEADLRVLVHTQPSKHGYRRVETLRDGDVLRPTQLPQVVLPVVEIPFAR